MKMGLVGQKLGMTRIFNEDGSACAVTVIEVKPNVVSQIKTLVTDGYDAIQVSVGERKINRTSKGLAGHFAKANVPAGVVIKEFRVAAEDVAQFNLGGTVDVSLFSEGSA